MQCPQEKSALERIAPHGVAAWRCSSCNGIWFPEDHLRRLKDAQDALLRWIDVDLWANPEEFRLSKSSRVCPEDAMPLYRAAYGDSGVTVDVCADHHGVWLDEGEFRAIIDWLRSRIEQETFLGYLREAGTEAAEIVTGSESVASETGDFLVVAKLLAYRLLVQFPVLAKIIAQLPT
ncbi:MAG: hypothetical protein A2991_03330 [Candidatus Terrybacteria bacterium RIFCSPLOWO2_01_FULL_58_14]|uniref:Transcription factor zinc-finger domain-containing protein n=2 Tax=Candidatus Terryibacteriota TaxID=1817920 RepID=A0A1G2PVS1_9BACT|nr:MAG: hypothetical protein A2682_02365 [Candidatus Terrybacteria bacterium RIFCSPHIGHO2_01_FULL_58_15]OHA52415.1 MAG: hypothetical protein A2991_03330 [Candidatus Terrybacteria bacterium RIFCSPLOWO2_01_FULL_58_14]